MAEFQVKGMSFKSGKMGLFEAVKVYKRLGPFVPDMILTYRAMEKGATWVDAAIVMGPDILKTFSVMKDEDVEHIISSCLAVVQYFQGDTVWVPLASNGRLQFQEVDLFCVSQIVWKVLEDNFRPFFLSLLAMSPAGKTEAASNG